MSLETILQELKNQTRIFGSILINVTGMPVAADLPPHIEKELISMIFATVLLTGEKGIKDNNYGNLERVSIRGDKGEMFLFRVKEDLILCILAPTNVSYGILILSVNNTIKKIKSVI